MSSTSLKKQSKSHRYSWSDPGPEADEPSALAPVLSRSGKTPRAAKTVEKFEKWRRISLYFALGLVFVRLSMIHQLLEYLLGTDTYLLYFVAIPVLIAIPTTGGFQRAFKYQPAWYWAAFALWLLPTSAFSSWKAGSLNIVMGYYRTELVLLFAIAGLVTTFQECRWLMYTISWAAVVNIITVLLFRRIDIHGRTSLAFGTVANSNDYSGHLIFVLPFLLWVILVTRLTIVRIVGFLVLVLALYEILAAGSRGAMIGLATAIIVFALTTTPKVRRIVLVTAPVLAMLVIALLPRSVSHRIFAFSSDDADASSEALESSHDRAQLLRDSIATVFRHPLFGVGTGQFANTEGQQTAQSGQRLWYGAHNSFTQVASENGFPGFIFYLGGVLSSLILLNKTGRFLSRKSGVKDAASAVLCVRIALISFCVTIFFLNFGYFFYLPALAGITIAIAASSKQLVIDLKAKESRSPVRSPVQSWS
ncbi:MAG: O-antigen ligase family protein [Candidatus Acidiferrum sp.]